MAPPVPSDPIMRQPSVDLGEKQEPRRMISDIVDLKEKELASCTPNREEVSLGSLLQDQLVQRQVGDRPAQTPVLRLQILQPLHLVRLQTTILLTPAVVRHFAYADRADRIGHALALRRQNVNLAQLGNNLFGLVSLPSHSWSSSGQKPYSESDHFSGGGSVT